MASTHLFVAEEIYRFGSEPGNVMKPTSRFDGTSGGASHDERGTIREVAA